jgi:hypothetical protein
MNIYKVIAKDLREVNATPRQAQLAFAALQCGGSEYLKYIEQLRERNKERILKELDNR